MVRPSRSGKGFAGAVYALDPWDKLRQTCTLSPQTIMTLRELLTNAYQWADAHALALLLASLA